MIAECGTGKTLISLAALHVHSAGRPFTAIVMAPGHITLKWCKEALETIPRLRVFLIDGLRDRVRDSSTPSGVNEVKLRRGQIVREGLHTTLTDLRLRKNHKSARARWQQEICSGPAVFVVGRDKGKLSHFWRHAYQVARSGRYLGSVVNPDTGVRVELGERWLISSDFRKARLGEVIGGAGEREDGPVPSGRSIVRYGRPMARESLVWLRSISSDALCRAGSTTPYATRLTSWPMIRHRGTVWER
jgi:hypothetical protein